jgi:hypothetical protein
MSYVEKYDKSRQATNENITRRIPIASWITKATDHLSKYEILIAFPPPQCLR